MAKIVLYFYTQKTIVFVPRLSHLSLFALWNIVKNNEKIDLVLMTDNGEVQPRCEKYLGMNYHEMIEVMVTRNGKKENVSVKMVNNKAGASKHQRKRGKEIRDLSVP